MNNAKGLLEELARDTWNRLRYSHQFGISQGEETISDLNLLELRMRGIPEIKRVEKCPKPLERWRGIDWEWVIGSNRFGWIKYAVQAKKLSLESNNTSKGRYNNLHEPFKDGSGDTQLKVLERFARANKMVPLYCLYNYIDKRVYSTYWNCKSTLDEEQLGCSVTTLNVVKNAIATRGGRSFDNLHYRPETVPWRCLVGCPTFLNIYIENAQKSGGSHNSRPTTIEHELLGEVIVHNQTLDTVTTSFDAGSEGGPKRLLIIDIDSSIAEAIG